MVVEWASVVLLLAGTFFMLVASIGIVRMPDVYLRMSCTSKAATLGSGCLLAAYALQAPEVGVAVRAVATAVFLLLTAPVAAHMIGRAAYRLGVPLWAGSCCDELRGKYSDAGDLLRSSPAGTGNLDGQKVR
ncbi:MAG: monovalent cation/H(+) antiporter subunit G [Candidatus Binatia bacterium]|nr:monovalent cation/H(+) antiporter subunit G [Candidatus Binatia bacterium]